MDYTQIHQVLFKMNLSTIESYFELFPESIPAGTALASTKKAIERRIKSVSAAVEGHVKSVMNRNILSIEREQLFTPAKGTGTRSIRLNAFPVESISKVVVFDSELTEANDEFEVNKELGIISFSTPISQDWSTNYLNAIYVKWTGGLAKDTAEFMELFPDVEERVLTQVRFEMQRYKDIASKSIANGQTTSQLNPYGLMPALLDSLERFRTAPWT